MNPVRQIFTIGDTLVIVFETPVNTESMFQAGTYLRRNLSRFWQPNSTGTASLYLHSAGRIRCQPHL